MSAVNSKADAILLNRKIIFDSLQQESGQLKKLEPTPHNQTLKLFSRIKVFKTDLVSVVIRERIVDLMFHSRHSFPGQK
jgi:hypothetical protein